MGKRKTANIISYGVLAVIIALVSYWIYQKPVEDGVEFIPEPVEAEVSEINVSKNKVTPKKLVRSKENLSRQDEIVNYGLSFLGTPYVEAGCSKDGFDCSGFIYFVFQHFKIDVPRSSSGYENFGQEIPIGEVRKGDVLVFLSPTRDEIGHIGIVSKANGIKSDFVHSSSGKEMSVIKTSLKNSGYRERFVKAVRVLK